MYADAELPRPPSSEWSLEYAAPPPLDPNSWHGYISESDQRRAQIGYYGLITQIDFQIGRLLYEMRTRKCLNNTFAVMTADHGEMLGDHNLWRKTYPYEGSTRVPFICRFRSDFDPVSGQK